MIKYIAAAIVLLGLGFTAGITFRGDVAEADPPAFTSIYDNDDVYWVFRHREGLCNIATEHVVGGEQPGEAIETVVVDSKVLTRDAQMYLRGVLVACLDQVG